MVCEPFRQLQSRLSNPHDRFVKLVSARPPNKGTSLPKTVRCLTNYNRPSMRVFGPRNSKPASSDTNFPRCLPEPHRTAKAAVYHCKYCSGDTNARILVMSTMMLMASNLVAQMCFFIPVATRRVLLQLMLLMVPRKHEPDPQAGDANPAKSSGNGNEYFDRAELVTMVTIA